MAEADGPEAVDVQLDRTGPAGHERRGLIVQLRRHPRVGRSALPAWLELLPVAVPLNEARAVTEATQSFERLGRPRAPAGISADDDRVEAFRLDLGQYGVE